MPRTTFLSYFQPSIGEDEINEVIDTLKSGWVTTGEKSHIFERNFADYLGVDCALALNSCTAALHLALLLLNIKPGDEVITTPFTFVATSNVIEYLHARPVFVDIERDTLNIDPNKIEEKITNKTKAILIVHYGGHACEMNAIMDIANKYSIPVVEDAAHGMGGSYHNKKLGRFGTFSAFSFYANKNITTIEGGMLIGNKELINKARIMSLHGIDRDAWKRYRQDGSWFYEVIYPGLKYNMTDVSASIGLHQLKKINSLQGKRSRIANSYNAAFKNNPFLEVPCQKSKIDHAWFNYPLRLNLERLKISKAEFINELTKLNIGTSVHFIPVHLHPYYKNKYGYVPNDFPVAYKEYQRVLSIPLYPAMLDSDVEDVIESICLILNKVGEK